jgi:hypothetical protein
VLTLTSGQAKSKAAAEAEAAAEAAAEAKAAILTDNSKATDIFISGVQGVNSVINGLYLPTEETGQDGRRLYRKSGESGEPALCIEHDDEGCWVVKNESDIGSSAKGPRAYVRGGCALEECCSRLWSVCNNGKYHIDQPGVKVVTGDEAKSMASSHSTLAPQCNPSLPSILSRV